ncbi:hypothetical protein IKG10_00395 [Candidatus Saccharibacteria bacterium]|nr:hypothetical protein [Candidatus Saccharibacteria bacterium]
MAKENAIGKRAKISEAQQYMLLSVLAASVFFGVAISLVSFFIKQISFNTRVIEAEEKSIVSYSNFIESVGICKKPGGDVYSLDELKKCNPDTIELSEIPNTLRSNILTEIAANKALSSVPKEDSSAGCVDPNTGKNYTYDALMKNYQDVKDKGSEAIKEANQRIKTCSALRVIPDALPAFKNEEALMASVDMLYRISGWQPESLRARQDASTITDDNSLNTISVDVSIEANSGITTNILHNFERSIRELDIEKATIGWKADDKLSLTAQASAYYTTGSSVAEKKTIIKAEGK